MSKDIKYSKDISLSGLLLCTHPVSLATRSILHTTPGPSVLLREPHTCLHQLPLPFSFLPATIKPFPTSLKITFVKNIYICPITPNKPPNAILISLKSSNINYIISYIKHRNSSFITTTFDLSVHG